MSRSGNIIFLGAGFSKWCCDLPLVSQLFDFQISPYTKKESSNLEKIKARYTEWKSTSKSYNAENFVEFCLLDKKYSNIVNWYITRRLTEPFTRISSRRFTWYINSNQARYDKGISKAREFLHHTTSLPNSTIITTNYDMIVEYPLSSKGFNYGKIGESIGYSPYPYPRPIFASGNVSLLKLHGSISWDSEYKYPDQRCGLNGKCIIVPPKAYKKPRKIFPEIWQLAEERLKSANKIVFFGFAFNEYDEEIIALLQETLLNSNGILLIDIFDHRQRIRKIFPNVQMEFLNALDFRPSQAFKFIF